LLKPDEIERVIDYVMFLSMRGEVQNGLVYLAQDTEDANAESELGNDQVQEVMQLVFDRWKNAESNVLDPKVARTPSTPESIARGRQLFLGEKGLQCYGCHGLDGKGNGESFVEYKRFVKAVFEGNPSPTKITELKDYAEKTNKKWGDDWGHPLRPANLTAGVYKGGRRPIDIYWRIAKGINGTPMPVHLGSQLKSDEEVWDLVNFVLALPYDPKLLEGAKPVPGASLTTDAPRPPSEGILASQGR
jgi:mono/diheme cytochrome c family protein